MRLKILSYNIHKGFDWANQTYCLHQMKDLIKSSSAEIVLLQEVVGKNKIFQKNGLIDSQFEFLADELWPHYSYAQNALYDHGHHGNLILSKYPIENFENIDVSTNRWEKRGMLVCKINIPNKRKILVGCLHLNLFHSGRKLQYMQIKNYFDRQLKVEKTPLIIAGDFNDWNQKSYKIFEERLEMQEAHKFIHGHLAKTFPAKMPRLCLDRIYVKDLQVVKSHVIDAGKNNLSDHLPLYCEVVFDD